jgi:hypothetical protein
MQSTTSTQSAEKSPQGKSQIIAEKGKNPLSFTLFRAPPLLRFLCHDFCGQRKNGTLLFTIHFSCLKIGHYKK